MRLGDPTPIPP